MDEKLSAVEALRCTIQMVCTEKRNLAEWENNGNIVIDDAIIFHNLNNWMFNNPEVKDLYMTNTQFHSVMDCINNREGVTAPELISIFVGLCVSNKDMMDKLVEATIKSPLRPIIIQK